MEDIFLNTDKIEKSDKRENDEVKMCMLFSPMN